MTSKERLQAFQLELSKHCVGVMSGHEQMITDLYCKPAMLTGTTQYASLMDYDDSMLTSIILVSRQYEKKQLADPQPWGSFTKQV